MLYIVYTLCQIINPHDCTPEQVMKSETRMPIECSKIAERHIARKHNYSESFFIRKWKCVPEHKLETKV